MNNNAFALLGGAEEIGANCTYLNLGGNGFFIDAGLHPQNRKKYTFPDIDILLKNTNNTTPYDALLITHAHTDHIGGIPYLLHKLPHLHLLSTRPTRDIMQIMLKNTIRLLTFNPPDKEYWPESVLENYNSDILEKIELLINSYPYKEQFTFRSVSSHNGVDIEFYDAGHILGSAGIALECDGFSVFHTGDVQFEKQSLLPGASFPRRHFDLVFTEATNCSVDPPDRSKEIQRLAKYINEISESNGSILIPAFALGKSQELLTVVWNLMYKGLIPHLPMYSGGMTKSISNIYDKYCYSVPRIHPGFEVADIPQNPINREELLNGDYFKKPSIVIATSGMMNPGTVSFELAREWFRQKNYGIAIVGWQDPEAPGANLLTSERNQALQWGSTKLRRGCRVEKFSFTAHARREKIIEWLSHVRPKTLVIMHGETDSCERLAEEVSHILSATKIILPKHGKLYHM